MISDWNAVALLPKLDTILLVFLPFIRPLLGCLPQTIFERIIFLRFCLKSLPIFQVLKCHSYFWHVFLCMSPLSYSSWLLPYFPRLNATEIEKEGSILLQLVLLFLFLLWRFILYLYHLLMGQNQADSVLFYISFRLKSSVFLLKLADFTGIEIERTF